MIRFFPPETIKHSGDLLRRCDMLAGRLESDIYRLPAVFENGKEWPGDWCGRTILAQTLLYGALDRVSPYLRDTVSYLPAQLNEKGYFGDIGDQTDEQQLSGHSWLLRGLCEYYGKYRDPSILDIISGIVNGLYLPIYDRLSEYRAASTDAGGYSGSIASDSGKWRYSSDTGCAFISLDGLSAVYETVLPLGNDSPVDIPALKRLIDRMIDIFGGYDIVGLRLQTHATLTAARGILRMYGISAASGHPDDKLLKIAEGIFDLYISDGMSAAYGNYNWFRRPEWTEPCAIIDSFMVAVQLFAYTGNSMYINTTSKIKSAVYHSQRSNGGFGCDTCVGAVTDSGMIDKLSVSAYEAYWCCTMRGGEGLSRIAQYSYLDDGDTLIIPYLTDSTLESEGIRIEQTTCKNGFRLKISGNTRYKRIRILTHGRMWNVRVKGCPYSVSDEAVEIKAGFDDEMTAEYDISLFRERCPGRSNAPDAYVILDRDSILGCLSDTDISSDDCVTAEPADDGIGVCYKTGSAVLRRIDDSYLLGDGDKDACYRLLFR